MMKPTSVPAEARDKQAKMGWRRKREVVRFAARVTRKAMKRER